MFLRERRMIVNNEFRMKYIHNLGTGKIIRIHRSYFSLERNISIIYFRYYCLYIIFFRSMESDSQINIKLTLALRGQN